MDRRLEEDIKQLVSRIIHVPAKKIDINADLFKVLGADSLKAIEIIVSVEKKYKIKLPLKKLSKIKTIGQIIEFVKNAKKV